MTIDNDYMRKLPSLIDNDNTAKITGDALTLLNWAAEETRKGRQISPGTSNYRRTIRSDEC